MATGWIPVRENAHPAVQSIAVGAYFDFDVPEGADGFMLGGDGPIAITFDGTTASATNGLGLDPGKGTTGIFPISPSDKLSVYNRHTSEINVTIAWLEALG